MNLRFPCAHLDERRQSIQLYLNGEGAYVFDFESQIPSCLSLIRQPVHCIVWAKELPFAKLFGEAGLANDLDMRSDDQGEEPSEEDTNWHRIKENETPTAYARRVSCQRLYEAVGCSV